MMRLSHMLRERRQRRADLYTEAARVLRAAGITRREMAAGLGVVRTTLWRRLKRRDEISDEAMVQLHHYLAELYAGISPIDRQLLLKLKARAASLI